MVFGSFQDGRPAETCAKEKAYQVSAENTDSRGYAFTVMSKPSVDDSSVTLVLGDIEVRDVLVDSGATCNLMDKQMWTHLKERGIKCQSQRSDKKIFAYGQTQPIEIEGVFTTSIACADSGVQCTDEFIVIKGTGRTLLGKITAQKLNVLRVGPPSIPHVYSVTTEGNSADFREEFADVFNGVGKLKDYKLKLHIDRTVTPVAQPVRRIPFSLRDKVDKKLDELQEMDIIEPVTDGPTDWVSPLVVVPKAGGDVRICVDMRRANEAIIRERHPIPTIEDLLYQLNGSTVFTKLDLRWGFHQIELDTESRNITTFVTHRGIYRYKRLMFGIASAPEKYQQIVKDILKGCPGVANIADDIIIHDEGKGVSHHDDNVRNVLQKLRECGMTLNEKCVFRLPRLTFFGHTLGSDGISPSEEKIEAINNARQPKDAAEVRSFLGLVQYCSKFIPDCSQVQEPLRKVSRHKGTFSWGAEQETAFNNLKRLITCTETLAYYRNGCKTRVVADASPTGLGAVLIQHQDGMWRVIAYASRSLTDVERRYSQTEKEALALVWSCERFHLYTFGNQFELETDHKPLECIYSTTSKPSARIERWVLRLQGYDYKVVYRPGATNIADALSRLNQEKPCDKSAETIDFVRYLVEESTPVSMSPREVERASECDSELASVRHYILNGKWSECKIPAYSCIKNELCVLGKLVLRGTRIVIPEKLRAEVLRLAHEGHQGIVKMKARLRTKVWWPKMDSDAEKICKSCHGCQVVGEFPHPEPMQRTMLPSGPWQDLALDLMGPLPDGQNILVVVDYYSRFVEAVMMKVTTTEKICQALEPIFCRYGYPFSLKTDNGPQFVSESFEHYLECRGIEHRKSTPLWPQANGEVERQNRTILKALKVAAVGKRDLKKELDKFLLAYRCTPQSCTNATPASLMFGREIRTKLPELRPESGFNEESVRDKDCAQKQLGKEYADGRRNAAPRDIAPGDLVLVKNKTTGKLEPNYETQPYIIQTREGRELLLKSPEGREQRRNTSFVKKYVAETPDGTPSEMSEMSPGSPMRPEAEKPMVSTPVVGLRRSARTHREPIKMKDFVRN